MKLTYEEFESLVVDVLDTLPADILSVLDNLDVVIEDWPTEYQLESVGAAGGMLLGLYEGIPLTQRTGGYNLVAPDKITIFQRPIERMCRTKSDIAAQVRKTVIHEVAHHFGIGEQRLDELGWS